MTDEAMGGDGISPGEGPHGNTEGTPKSEKKRTFSPDVEQRMAEIAQQLNDAGMSDHVERFRFFSEKVDELRDNPAEKDAIKDSIKEKLEAGQYPIRRENLEHWINEIHPEMEPSDKEELLALVEEMTPDEKGEPTEQEESTMEEKKNKLLEEAQATYDEIDASDLDDVQKHAALGMVGRIRGLFAPGEAGHVWTKRLGKGLGYTALAIAIALLAYMKAIHTISRQGGRR